MKSYFLSRHMPTPEQAVDMERIAHEKGADSPYWITNWDASTFKDPNLKNILAPGSILFLVGTSSHIQEAIEKGYIVIKPYMQGTQRVFCKHKLVKQCIVREEDV